MAGGEEYPPLFLKGVEYFNDSEFFEAHDAWEEYWTDHTGDDRSFFKGLIQMAVCLHHFGRGNTRGARKLYRTSRDYLAGYLPYHLGIDLTQLFVQFDQCCAGFIDLADQAATPDISLDANLLPQIRLHPPAAEKHVS